MERQHTPDAPLVPQMPDADEPTPVSADGGRRRRQERPFDRPPRTDYAADYTRDEEEIEPGVADLR